ncbi:nucleotide disphospho-sugar-binding domain-containing protein [Streptomyces sp. NPDC089799]|uniref:nucleotide disphospho-sugar-binding domain-containing protein n=1 Tax=Streptomyces sp. NPDC089799 TaxID=3155066 RepID=UPI00342F7C8F
MRVLFVFEGGAGAILPLVPLAQAFRSAGHEVIAAAHADALPNLLGAGLAAVAAPQKAPADYRVVRDGKLVPLTGDRDERAEVFGSIGAQIAVDSHRDLQDLVRRWPPDLLVGGPLASGAQLLAAQTRIPYAAVEFGFAEPRNWHRVTAAELRRQGFTDLPEPDITLILAPDELRTPPGDSLLLRPEGSPLRYVPYAPAQPVEPWMHAKGDRPRVWISAGSRVSKEYALDYLTGLIESAAGLDVELLIAVPDHLADALGRVPDHARVGWLPFDVLAPTCDLAVHHGGGSTLLGAAAHGVPQLVIPSVPEFVEWLQPAGRSGAVRLLGPADNTPAAILAASREMLADPSYRQAAERLQDRITALPSPHETVGRLEAVALAGARS